MHWPRVILVTDTQRELIIGDRQTDELLAAIHAERLDIRQIVQEEVEAQVGLLQAGQVPVAQCHEVTR